MSTRFHVHLGLGKVPAETRCTNPIGADGRVVLHLDDLALIGTPGVLRATLTAALAAIDQATS